MAFRNNWPAFVAIGIFWTLTAFYAATIQGRNDGKLIYLLDDTYIHMAIAKHVVERWEWSVDLNNFSSASSSPLWTGLLAASYRLSSRWEQIPLILNAVFASLFLLCSHLMLKKHQIPGPANLLILLALMMLTPLVVVVFCGMEHTLHLFLTASFVFIACGLLSAGDQMVARKTSLLFLAGLLVLSRYEGIFAVLAAAILFFYRRNYRYSVALIAAGLIPIALCGIISVRFGSDFLPNSVALKGNMPSVLSFSGAGVFLYRVLVNIGQSHMVVLLAGSLLLLKNTKGHITVEGQERRLLLIMFLMTSALHLVFASVGQFYRYEAYLVALGILSVSISLYRAEARSFRLSIMPNMEQVVICVLVVLMSIPLVLRGVEAVYRITSAATNIYEQQYQMGLFVQRFYSGSSVAANDIGAINFLADIKCLDMMGLGSVEIARARKAGALSTDVFAQQANNQHVSIAMVYEPWFRGARKIPPDWRKVGEWTIPSQKDWTYATVSFFAVDKKSDEYLIESLRQFADDLPASVEQRGPYLSAVVP